jgi:antitoxin CptB
MLGRTGSDSRQAMMGRPSYPALGGRKRAMTDELEIDRKRLKFRSWHRGTREMDLLLGRFADQRLNAFDAEAVGVYAALLEESDPDIYNWVTGREECPSGVLRPLIADLAEFHSSISS